MEWTENKTKLLIEEVEKHPCLYNCMFVLAIYCLYAIVQLLKQFYCARKLRHKLPQFIAVCVMDLRWAGLRIIIAFGVLRVNLTVNTC